MSGFQWRAALLLAAFALAGSLLLALTWNLTAERIAEQQRQATLRQLAELLPRDLYDNDPLLDTLELPAGTIPGLSGPVTGWVARKQGTITAWLLNITTAEGYNGNIRLLVGLKPGGELLGVRVTTHSETPGLGDGIDLRRSDWILAFAGKALGRPPAEGWAVKKDCGVFDQFTGATITPRAVVKAVRNLLQWYASHPDVLQQPPAKEVSP